MVRANRLYAELFLHIRVVTIYASFSSPDFAQDATIAIAANGRSITFTHKSEKASISLPTRVRPQSSFALLNLASKRGNSITIRLNLDDELTKEIFDSYNDTDFLMSIRSRNPVPWTSLFMNSNNLRIMCAQCGSNIQPAGKVKRWLDLPNENWADLMEFWHCHKPPEHQQSNEKPERQLSVGDKSLEAKGYFAANRLHVSQGKGFIGTLYFLLHKDDCDGVKVCELRFHVGFYLI